MPVAGTETTNYVRVEHPRATGVHAPVFFFNDATAKDTSKRVQLFLARLRSKLKDTELKNCRAVIFKPHPDFPWAESL